MNTLDSVGFLAVRSTMGFLYLYALYMNVKDEAARTWLVQHTAYLFPNAREPLRTKLAGIFAVLGMANMLLGGISIVLGLEARMGALLLLLFTAGGIYQHNRERAVAMETATRVEPLIPAAAKADFATVQWSAYSGHFSSMLKNWALCGICAGIMAWGSGPYSVCDRLGAWLQHHL
jgi:uncharacterized membrane protein YphA (DoxX/SURF4 family)